MNLDVGLKLVEAKTKNVQARMQSAMHILSLGVRSCGRKQNVKISS